MMLRADQRDAAKGGSELVSLELMYRRHSAWLLQVIRRRFGRDQADDLVQETYLRAAAYQGTFVAHPRALLIQIATRAAIDRGRRAAARPLANSECDRREHFGADQLEALAVKQVILSLPDGLRDVFVLSRYASLTYEEIAQRCGISVKTVEWRMSKALKLCAERLRS